MAKMRRGKSAGCNKNQGHNLLQNRTKLLDFTTLEPRHLMAGAWRSFDGEGNNLANLDWGSTAEVYLRVSTADYADGTSTPAGEDRANAREISNIVSAQNGESIINDQNLSAFVYAWGQFLDHDIDLTVAASPAEAFLIQVPTGDVDFDPDGTGNKTIPLSRSAYEIDEDGIRQQINSITAFVDGSQIYGSSDERAAALRTFKGGRLKVSDGNLLPYNTEGLDNDTVGGDPASYFLAGDVRANENVELIAMQTLFMREHNRVADAIAQNHHDWSDERIYQTARRWVIAELQAITYNEFLPAILGKDALTTYQGYRANVNPGIANEFAAAAYRFGHSMIGTDIEFLDNNGNEIQDPLEMRDAFFNPSVIDASGIDSILKYLATDRAQEIDIKVVDDLRSFLFGAPGSGGLDLAALNIQRGRDHGLADYNSVRIAYGLKPVTDFTQITRNPETQQALQEAYGTVDSIDLWVGGLAEDHAPGASVGPTFKRIIADQVQRLRDGDRYWYQNTFSGQSLKTLESTTLSRIIKNNSTTRNIQPNVFIFRTEITGTVFGDGNRNGQIDSRDQRLAGILVQLRTSSDELVKSTRTDCHGTYRFSELDIDSYRVRIIAPPGSHLTTALPKEITFTRGQVYRDINFGLARQQNGSHSGGNHFPIDLSTLDSAFVDLNLQNS